MHHVYRVALALALLILLSLPAASLAQPQPALLRVIHAAPTAPAVDVYANGVPILRNLAFFALSEYLALPPGQYTIQVTPANAGLDDAFLTGGWLLTNNTHYTLMAVSTIENVGGVLEIDNQNAPPPGQARVKLYHTVPDAPPIDVKLAGTGTSVLRALPFTGSAALTVPAGTYQFDITPAGSPTVIYTTPPLRFEPDWGYTLTAVGFLEQPGTFGVRSHVDFTAPAAAATVPPPQAAERVYVAELRPLNTSVTEQPATGTARFTISGDTLTMQVNAQGLYPGTMHLQHYHGFVDGQDATCPPAVADANSDGFIDLVETQPFTGITLVPLHDDPASLEIQVPTYPIAGDPGGAINYAQTVSVNALESALLSTHGIADLALEQRTVFLHGVNPNANLPESVQSLPNVPAQVTLPVACGEIVRVQ